MTVFIHSVRPSNNGSELAVTLEMSEPSNNVSSDIRVRGRRIKSNRRVLHVLASDWTCLMSVRGEIDEELLDKLENADRYCTAVRVGMRILAYGANSQNALYRKLIHKGCDAESSQKAAEYLCGCGFVDEYDDACRVAERDLKKFYGKRRILSNIHAKGYGTEVVSYVSDFLGDVDFVGLCAELISKKYREIPLDAHERQKMCAALVRYGYSPSEIREAILKISEV